MTAPPPPLAGLPDYGRPVAGDDPAIIRLLIAGFGYDQVEAAACCARLGVSSWRLLRWRGRIVAVAAALPLHQGFGGRAVPALALAEVTVAPRWRGRGWGALLVRHVLAEAAADGRAVARLHTADWSLYRRLGFAPGGVRLRHRLAVDDAPTALPADVRLADRAGRGGRIRVRDDMALLGNGLLRRSEPLWAMAPADDQVFVVLRGDRPVGYGAPGQLIDRDTRLLADWGAVDGGAARAVLAAAAARADGAAALAWDGGPDDGLVLAATVETEVIESETWQARVVDIGAALAGRGYPPGLTASLDLLVDDPDLPANRGGWRLSLADGRAAVQRLTEPGLVNALHTGPLGLTALFTGHVAPATLAAAGWIDGPAAAIAVAGLMFSGPRPWCPDQF